jgi:hypothetical protein
MGRSAKFIGSALLGAVALVALSPLSGSAQPADYLKGTKPWYEGAHGVSGLWEQQGYISSSTNPPRARVARTLDGKIPPMLPWAQELLEKRLVDAEHGKPFANTASQCLPQGVPYLLFAAVGGPLQILETPGQVTLINDAYNEMWFVYLGAKHPPQEDLEPTYHGDSVGHWEGDTLVIDTLGGFNTKTTLDQVGMPHSDSMHVITKVRRTDADHLEFLVTVDDPKTFSAPWTRRVTYKKAANDARVAEEVCDNQRNGMDANGYQRTGFGPPASDESKPNGEK